MKLTQLYYFTFSTLIIFSFTYGQDIQFLKQLPPNPSPQFSGDFIQVESGKVTTVDLDKDYDIDLIISGQFLGTSTGSRAYLNDGKGNFSLEPDLLETLLPLFEQDIFFHKWIRLRRC